MCGITGYISKEKINLSMLLNSLKKLEYRGYDSSGIAYLKNNKINIIKSVGKISSLESLVEKDEKSLLSIGHTRWATHGVPSFENSHPHKYGHIILVHNGIIENADNLKKEFIKKGICFNSDTDTEVIAVLLNTLYEEYKNMNDVLKHSMKILKGSYALGIICDHDIEHLYCMKKESPLIIGLNDNMNFIASDILAIYENANKYLILDDLEYASISSDKVTIYDKNGKQIEKEEYLLDEIKSDNNLNDYEHFMLKEINEQPYVINKLYLNYINNEKELRKKLPDFSKYNHIDIIGCGSAYHAGLIGKFYLESTGIPVNVHLASEYRYGNIFPSKKNLVILVSQSGETADTLAALKLAKENNMDTLSIVNVLHSTIARTSDYVFYTDAKEEVAVATTKGYSTQVISFIILSLIINNKKLQKLEYEKEVLKYQKQMIDLINYNYDSIINILKNHNNNFYIGRLIDYALAMEGALKLKEITYINSVSYAAGELKHGTISLIDNGFPVIALVTDSLLSDKTFNNLKEVKARGATVIAIISEELDNDFDFIDEKIIIPKTSYLVKPIMSIIPLQMIAYKLAYILGKDIDKPRNLAKSVTVE